MSFSFPHLLSLSYRRIPSVLLSLIIITVFFTVFVISKANATTVPTCSTDALENLIEAAEPGTTIKVPGGCIYRETVDVKKSVTLDGQGVAEIRGSDVWTGWTKVNGVDRWTKASTNATDFQQFGECKSNTDNRCKKRQQVFVDDEPLFQVSSNPGVGQFSYDSTTDVFTIGTDPTGKVVEVTTRSHWIVSQVSNVTIKNFTMRHAAPVPDQGGVHVDGYNNWTVRNSEFSDSAGNLISMKNGTNFQIIDSELYRSGGNGGGFSSATDVVLKGNKIYANNTEDFSPGWAAAGTKSALVTNFMIEENEIYDNRGNGIWCDIDCDNVTIRYNHVYNNESNGIQYEISNNAKIYGNKVEDNGWVAGNAWCFNAGILVQNSRNTEVYGNILNHNQFGISVISQRRGGTDNNHRWNLIVNDYIHNNYIINDESGPQGLSWCEDYAGPLFTSTNNNRGEDNAYYWTNPEWDPNTNPSEPARFGWQQGWGKLSSFNGTQGEERGHYLLATESAEMAVSGNGLLGEYFNNQNFTGTSLQRTDREVNFDWGTSSPDPKWRIGSDTFSVRWTGQVLTKYDETYTFYTNANDRVKLWVNDQLLIDSWTDQATTEHSGTIALEADELYDIKLEYGEGGNNALVELRWSSPSQTKEVIPGSNLFSSTDYNDDLANSSTESVTSFTLVNADTDQDIQTLSDGDLLNLTTLPTTNLNIRANVSGSGVESVRFALDDNYNFEGENSAPYAIAEDIGGDYTPWTPTVGTHTLTATPYTADYSDGLMGVPLSISFTVTSGQSISNFTLVNADSDTDIATITNGSTINIAALASRDLNIRANTNVSVGSVLFSYDVYTPVTGFQFIENDSPYALAGNSGTDYLEWTPTTGTHRLFATPFRHDNANTDGVGQALFTTFTVIDQYVTSLTLVNADTDQDIQTLTNGSTINLATLPTQNLSIRANVNTSVGSVKFGYDGNANYRVESVAPFTINGDGNNGADYFAWTGNPTVGSHTLTATTYSASGATGVAGPTHTVNFTVINQP